MKIAIDLDDVLVRINIIEGVLRDMNIPLKRNEIKSYGFYELPEKARKEVWRRFKMRKYMVDQAKPIRGTKKKMKEWAREGHEMFCLTSRDDKIAKATKAFVKKEFPLIQDTLVLNGTKKEALLRGGFDVLIDDALKYMNEALSVGVAAILISNQHTPYNWDRTSDDLPAFEALANVNLSVVSK